MIEPPLPSAYAIRGAKVIDGTGARRQRADVLVTEGRITVMGGDIPAGLPSLDASGLALAPGFIDAHAHADLQPLTARDPQVHASRVLQGVTTEVTGNCGFSPFPVVGERAETERFLSLLFGADAATFADLDTYAHAVEEAGAACNIAPLVGHGTLRAAELGMADRAPTPDELARMRRQLSLALTQGAFGLSTGLCYTPATFAEASEIRSLVGVVSEAGAIYATHVRNETEGIRQALEEAITTAAGTGAALHISHLKAAGSSNHGTASHLVGLLESARAAGVDVTADAYPYTAGSTMLHSLLPPHLIDAGIDAMFARLSDPGVRESVQRALDDGVPGWQNLGSAAGWERVTVASAPRHPEREGRTIIELAVAEDRFPADTIARVLLDEGGPVVAVIDVMQERDVRDILSWDHILIGSDGIPLTGKPHPRLTGTFPRVLARYADASLEAMIARMTGRTAKRFGLEQRGIIAPGAIADLVVFDPVAVADQSTYTSPWSPPTGVHHVLLGGEAAVWAGGVVDGSLGRVLKRR